MKKLSKRAALLTLIISFFAITYTVQAEQTLPTSTTNSIERDGNGQSLNDLYNAAIKEGGTLTVYAGGDEVTQGFGTKKVLSSSFLG